MEDGKRDVGRVGFECLDAGLGVVVPDLDQPVCQLICCCMYELIRRWDSGLYAYFSPLRLCRAI